MRAMTGGVSRRSCASSAAGDRPSFAMRDEPGGQLDARRAAAADRRRPSTSPARPAGRPADRRGQRLGARADRRRRSSSASAAPGRSRPRGRPRTRRASPRAPRRSSCRRAAARISGCRADALDRRRAPDDDAGLRAAEQLVAAEAADVDAGGDASSAPSARRVEGIDSGRMRGCRCRDLRRPGRCSFVPSATSSASAGRSVKPSMRKFDGWTRRISAVRSPIAAA